MEYCTLAPEAVRAICDAVMPLARWASGEDFGAGEEDVRVAEVGPEREGAMQRGSKRARRYAGRSHLESQTTRDRVRNAWFAMKQATAE